MGYAGRDGLSGVRYRLNEDFPLYFKFCKQHKIYIAETRNTGLAMVASPVVYCGAWSIKTFFGRSRITKIIDQSETNQSRQLGQNHLLLLLSVVLLLLV